MSVYARRWVVVYAANGQINGSTFPLQSWNLHVPIHNLGF